MTEPHLAMNGPAVLVVGSINVDFVCRLDRRPAGGETVLARSMQRSSGGKGANQAAAAARAGARVALAGAVGDDPLGAGELASLRGLGIDVSLVRVVPGATTGMAFITVTADGENAIVVASGANAEVGGTDAAAAIEAWTGSGSGSVVVLQSELPAAAIDAAAAACRQRGLRYVLNDGPPAALAVATRQGADPLVVNEHEARLLCAGAGAGVGEPGGDGSTLAAAVAEATGAASAVVTLGGRGSVINSAAGRAQLPPVPPRAVIDTTGAGDAFVGALAAALAAGKSLLEAAEVANHAGSEAVSWPGARPVLAKL